MFIFLTYKNPPELMDLKHNFIDNSEENVTQDVKDPGVEKILLINPRCPVRCMLEYIRKQCNLDVTTEFDLADETGKLKQLFTYPTFSYVDDCFENKRSYYLVVFVQAPVKSTSTLRTLEKCPIILPQINRKSPVYLDLYNKIRTYITGEPTAVSTTKMKRLW